MNGKRVHVHARLKRLTALLLLAILLLPGYVSASTTAGAETRVGVFDLPEPAFVQDAASLTLELQPGCELTYDQLASDSLLAARGAGRYLAGKAPKQVTPGTRVLEGQYVDDLGRAQPWQAHYDEYGRLIGRTDFNAGNAAHGIPDTHYHAWEYSAEFPLGREVQSHVPGVFPGGGR